VDFGGFVVIFSKVVVFSLVLFYSCLGFEFYVILVFVLYCSI